MLIGMIPCARGLPTGLNGRAGPSVQADKEGRSHEPSLEVVTIGLGVAAVTVLTSRLTPPISCTPHSVASDEAEVVRRPAGFRAAPPAESTRAPIVHVTPVFRPAPSRGAQGDGDGSAARPVPIPLRPPHPRRCVDAVSVRRDPRREHAAVASSSAVDARPAVIARGHRQPGAIAHLGAGLARSRRDPDGGNVRKGARGAARRVAPLGVWRLQDEAGVRHDLRRRPETSANSHRRAGDVGAPTQNASRRSRHRSAGFGRRSMTIYNAR